MTAHQPSPSSMRRLRSPSLRSFRSLGPLILAAMLLTCADLAACSQTPKLALQSISGLMPDLQLQMTDDNGRAVSAQDYRGDVVLLYFGYTHCPDVCPTTLAFLSGAIKSLGTDAARVRVLFVTVDPGRDTGALLRRYVSYFGPQFVGLRGPAAQLLALTRRYHAGFELDPPDRDGNYAIQHSSAVYIFDAHGRARLVTDATDQSKLLSHDLRALIAGA